MLQLPISEKFFLGFSRGLETLANNLHNMKATLSWT